MPENTSIGLSRRLLAVGTALVVVSLGAAGCASSDETSTGGGVDSAALDKARAAVDEASETPAKISETRPLSAAPPTGKDIVYIKGTTSGDEQLYSGVVEAAKRLGWTARSVSYDVSNIATLQPAMRQALRTGADYVVVGGIPVDQIGKSTVSDFEKEGVPIIITGAYPVADQANILADSTAANTRPLGGKVLADWFVADSKGKGKVLLESVTTYPALVLFAKSFVKEAGSLCPDCDVTEFKTTIAAAADGSMVSGLIAKLRADRSIKYIAFDYGGFANGFDAKLAAAGLDDVKVIGYGIDPVTAKSITDGQSKAWIGNNFANEGWTAVDLAARHSVGDDTTNTDAQTPIQLFTKQNVADLAADAVFREPEDAVDQFAALWFANKGQ